MISRTIKCASTSAPAPPPPTTYSQLIHEARTAFRSYRQTHSAPPPSSHHHRLTLHFPTSPDHTFDDAITPFDEGEWPGGIRQQFRALRPLVDAFLDGYDAPFLGFIESPADGLGLWSSQLQQAPQQPFTLVTLVSNATFAPFVKLLEGKYGSKILDDGHMVIVVNPSWTTSNDIGQFWDKELKRKASQIIGTVTPDSTATTTEWVSLCHYEDVRTAAGACGVLWRRYPFPWQLYATSERDDDDGEVVFTLESENLLLEDGGNSSATTRPDTARIISLLNEDYKGNSTEKGGKWL